VKALTLPVHIEDNEKEKTQQEAQE
jgi:hypothetical protein